METMISGNMMSLTETEMLKKASVLKLIYPDFMPDLYTSGRPVLEIAFQCFMQNDPELFEAGSFSEQTIWDEILYVE